ncbi:MAG TPA: alpha/beta hydrolase [Xanthobacteraceae bacterium]
MGQQLSTSRLSRRAMLGATAALAAGPALAEECRLGPAPHDKGPAVFMGMDQQELDASYDQLAYEPLLPQITKRLASNSEAMRARIGAPLRRSYGPSAVEGLDIYRAKEANAPIFVFFHGGAWLGGSAKDYGYPAEMFVNAGIHYVAVDFVAIKEAGGDLGVMAKQVRSAVAWVHNNAVSFGGDPARLYVGGHSSGGHLCGVVLVTDWQKEFGLPQNIIKGGLCMSGMYEMKPVALSARSRYVKFTDAMEDSMSALRHIDLLNAPITVTYGTFETPDFQRQSRDFAAAVKAAGKPVQLIEAPNYAHLEICESLGNPYGANGRAALAMMKVE